MAQRTVRWFKEELQNAKDQIKFYKKELASWTAVKLRMEAAVRKAEKESKPPVVPRNPKKLSSVKRYEMFNLTLKAFGPSFVYRDRRKNGAISVKVDSHIPVKFRPALKALADEVTVNKGTNGFGEKYRVERYVFNNIPRKAAQ